MNNKELVTVKVEKQIGQGDEANPRLVYPLNYGYVEKDGIDLEMDSMVDKQYAYIVGVDVPVDEFTGVLVAVVRRRDDSAKIWIVAPEDMPFTKQQLEDMVFFNEHFYDSFIEMLDEEMWDAYNAKEEKLGFVVRRSMAKELPEGVYHIVAMVYTITKTGKVLVTERSRNKTHPLRWEVTGGSILAGEDVRQGAIREVLEETGIIADKEDLQPLYHYVDDEKHVIYYAFINLMDKEGAVSLQRGETMDYDYLPLNEFYELVESERFVPSEQRRYTRFKTQIKDRIKEALSEY